MQKLEYSENLENILKRESEEYQCYAIMHLECSSIYHVRSIFINLPIILFSSLVGFFNVIDLFKYQNIVLGLVCLIISVAKSIDSFFAFSKRSEQHRLVSLQYNKIHKLILLQLSLPREERLIANDLYRIVTSDREAIQQMEPEISKSVISWFKDKYKDYDTCKPSICNGLTPTIINGQSNSPFS